MAGRIIADKWQNGDGTENYKCRAWVNFNGTGTVAINASGNVSSITDDGTGYYRVNFANAMPDINYSVTGFGRPTTDVGLIVYNTYNTINTVNYVYIRTSSYNTALDPSSVCVSVFR